MDYEEQRERIIGLALRARTEVEVSCAINELDAWVHDHPDDESIRDAYEPLTLRQMTFDKAKREFGSEVRV